MERNNATVMVGSGQFKHEDACPLFNPLHEVSEDVATVLKEFNSHEGCKGVAAGCNTCSSHVMHNNPDVDRYAYYVAQNRTGGAAYFGYDSEATAYQLIGIAVENGIDYHWDGDTTTKVLIGDSE